MARGNVNKLRVIAIRPITTSEAGVRQTNQSACKDDDAE